MKRNLGSVDRLLRFAGAAALGTCALFAPYPPLVRSLVFGISSCYLLFTALAGTCLGYKLIGKSTCPVAQVPGNR
jgi:hypothetical protein